MTEGKKKVEDFIKANGGKVPTRIVTAHHEQGCGMIAGALDSIEQKHGNMIEVAALRGLIVGLMQELGLPPRLFGKIYKRYPT